MNNIIGTIEDNSLEILVEMKDSGPKGEQGDDGYTPIKGVDYFDGKDGEQGIQGIPGETGKSIEYTWNGTQLGVRIEGETNYTYVNLKGDKGDKGDTGEVDYTNLELKADKTYVDSKVKTDVPADAKFTDTRTTINGKTGVILKDDIVALGILAQDITELRLGNFKFVFNEVENSLDLEVLA